jgi:hypothetical protein
MRYLNSIVSIDKLAPIRWLSVKFTPLIIIIKKLIPMNTRRTSPLPNPNDSMNKFEIDYQSNYIELYHQRMKDYRR